MSHHIVEFKDVFFRYPDGTEALKGVSFRITHGESVGVVGANGAGKSTILMQMNGYLLPTSGTVTIGDLQLMKTTRQEIRRKVGVVFQNPDDQLFMPTVQADVAFGPANLGLRGTELAARVTQALDAVDMAHVAGRSPHHLSGGQKRRVALATVLAMRPEILVLDEPSSNLDPQSRRDFANLLVQLDHTVLLATHDLPYAAELCPRSIIMNGGRVVADGPTVDILNDPPLLKANRLELPYGFTAPRR